MVWILSYFSKLKLKVAFAAFLSVCALTQSARAQAIHELDPGRLAGAFLVEDPDRPNLSVQLLIQAGEGDTHGAEGLARYLEHLVWLSVAETHPLANEVGANAFTSQWATGYSVSVPVQGLRQGLETLLAVFDTPSSDPVFMEEEIQIILQERETRTNGSDTEQTLEDSRRWLYQNPGSEMPQGLARSIIGSEEDILSFSVDQALTLHGQTHVPDRAILLVRGAATPDQLTPILEALVGTGGTFSQAPRPRLLTPPLETQVYESIEDTSMGPRFAYRKLIDVPGDPGAGLSQIARDESLLLLRLILGGTRDESLLVPLYYEDFLVADLSVSMSWADEDTLALLIFAEPEPGVTLAQVEAGIEAALAATAARGVSQDTLDRTRDLILRERASRPAADAAFSAVSGALVTRQPIITDDQANAALRSLSPQDLNDLITALAAPGREARIFLTSDPQITEETL